MTDVTTGTPTTAAGRRRHRPEAALPALIAALAAGEIVILGSDLGDPVRPGLAGLVALALVTLAFELGRKSRLQ